MKTVQSRREFLKLSVTGVFGASQFLEERCEASGKTSSVITHAYAKSFGVGLQLYTVREAMDKSVLDTLKRISDIGYKYLELAGYSNGCFYGYKPVEFKKIVNDLGMRIVSSHAGLNLKGMTDDEVKKIAEDHTHIGSRYIIQPFIQGAGSMSVADYQRLVAVWNRVAMIMDNYNIRFGYHNHNFEFGKTEGKIPYFDIFLKEMDRRLTTMELDLFWCTKAGYDPVGIFKKYPGRFELLHIKDMFSKEEPFYNTDSDDFAPVGAGVINFRRILASKEIAGMKYMFVEQDNAAKGGDPFQAIATSFTNLTTKIL